MSIARDFGKAVKSVGQNTWIPVWILLSLGSGGSLNILGYIFFLMGPTFTIVGYIIEKTFENYEGKPRSETLPKITVKGSVNGDIKMEKGDTISFSNMSNSNINIKSRLDNVSQIISTSPTLTDSQQGDLIKLINKLELLVKPLSEEHPRAVERIVKQAETLSEEIATQNQDKSFLNITLEGLKKAAEAFTDIEPNVLTVIGKIASLIASI
ncbi:MAG: hypothetical protein AAGA80_04685 [Cyanobacteria bacterium P01_F01_bin.143]